MAVSTDKTSQFKSALANSLLVLASVAVTFAILEVVFFRLILPGLPLTYRAFLPDRADFFLQVSKSNYVPRDYIALAGDSYAQGMGDWLLSQGVVKNSQPYHSADVIHERLGRDVVSVGRASAGSAESMVLRVMRIHGDDYCYLFPQIETPKRFLIYFYEGNDIDDNFKKLEHLMRPSPGDLAPQIDEFLEEDYGHVSSWRCHIHLLNTIWKAIQFHSRYGLNPDLTYHVDPVPPTNRILIRGEPTNARELNVPSLALDESQMNKGFLVYQRSLAWFHRRYPNIPTTVVYIPSPTAMYRFANKEVVSHEVYVPSEQHNVGDPHLTNGIKFPIAAAYARSQQICQRIRTLSLTEGVGFIDTRPAFRKAAAERPMHGPRDWNHLNETGYRLLGNLLARRIDEQAADSCDDRWSSSDPLPGVEELSRRISGMESL